jgi:hypothetical protein
MTILEVMLKLELMIVFLKHSKIAEPKSKDAYTPGSTPYICYITEGV